MCDVLVIGAGIHGAAVAYAAALQGYSVRVIEQFSHAAEGTSSRSSKLIHGGLRYLESGQFRLVRQCLQEQRTLLKERPSLVTLTPFYIPVYASTTRPPWKIAAGLWLYQLLGGHRFTRLPESDWDTLDGLNTGGLRAVFRYFDAQTDDRELTRAILHDAGTLGAKVSFNTIFEQAICEPAACQITCCGPAGKETLTARAVVNASGPWVNRVLEHITPRQTPVDIELVQGTHIIVPGSLKQGIYYLEAPQDQRAIFIMPWQDRIMIGTTETHYQGDPADVHPLEEEQTYLLDVYNHYFNSKLDTSDVIEAFAGLRVLPASHTKVFNRSRDTMLHYDENTPRLLSIYGGKLTSHAHTAAEIMKHLTKLLRTG
ncbi:glycerol-3-phosphate dehydrogenase [Thiogranum longum]|uniref:Glycerol-3-phosphate dehydrogenase n=2 Tax=Thiogranum longum TaxID=1537524 RepID=A0A4R1HAZ8_9GAMM|nr:glycerol-3-phosphate dehydrogenase [Thiogranum longum]